MVGITNVSLCKVQTGERRLSKKKMKILADVLNVSYTTVLQCAGDDVENEYKCAKNRLVQEDENIILLLDGIVENSEDVEILKEVISILNKSTKRRKNRLEKNAETFKNWYI